MVLGMLPSSDWAIQEVGNALFRWLLSKNNLLLGGDAKFTFAACTMCYVLPGKQP